MPNREDAPGLTFDGKKRSPYKYCSFPTLFQSNMSKTTAKYQMLKGEQKIINEIFSCSGTRGKIYGKGEKIEQDLFEPRFAEMCQ